ncbi:MAG: hypothetical protein A2287_05120 [Candidatus Melainabacteria bacterium RIFOXYA12_FULL_32_12]|nr:MAG: hypothetical protein A2255_06320 [Candidatus Melainabacteria bacterium RIFOXYA2_FULL_32_9]OGI28903.1 MAG: hypothetical protein A2287_05120 [Candidatus Melainabacteria bacterium RIFOXYA12_FULL_32_12]
MDFKVSFDKLDELDKKIVALTIQEKTNSEIADLTGFSSGYIKKRLAFLFKKYNVKTKVGLVREIFKFGFCNLSI